MLDMQVGMMTVSELVDDYFSDSFGDGRKHFPNFLRIAYALYNDIYYKKLRKYQTKYLQVDQSTMTAKLPVNCSIVIGAGVKDCRGDYIPFYHAKGKIHPVDCVVNKCGCKSCKCNSDLCSAFTNIELSYEDIVIDNVTYKKSIKTRMNPIGQVTQEIKEPYKALVEPGNIQAGYNVQYRTYTETVCNLKVKPCGCIEDVPENHSKCHLLPGLLFPGADCVRYYPRNYDCTHKKHYDIDLEEKIIYLYDVVDIRKVVLMYIPAGLDITEEIIVPQWMAEPLKSGIYFKSMKYRAVSESTKLSAKRQFAADLEEMFGLLWPILPHEMIALQQTFMKW